MPHILFLMSDTGGGHRAAARAIEAALQVRHPDQVTVELVDLWKDYMPFPLSTMPRTYAHWINRSPSTYSAQFWANERLFASARWSRMYCAQMFPRMKRMYADHPADMIVCVHSVFVRPAVYALRKLRLAKPFITVITDYAWPPIVWYDPAVDRCLVPTEPAYRRALALGLQPSQLALTGAPVHPKFTNVTLTRREARDQLGWNTDAPVILLVGGGDGMGPLVATAQAIDSAPTDASPELVVVAGKNQAMKAALDAISWKRPTRIYGFVDNLQVFMRAADLLITKAGPATITEAAIIGVPLVLNGAIKYQESPNIDYVVEHHAGVYAPGPRRVAESISRLLTNNGTALHDLAQGIKSIAQPDAIWQIADEVWAYAEKDRAASQ
jgi:1,2-diacylglycerol 3-beta-galactosyltransferase